jgi:hypothetical protein
MVSPSGNAKFMGADHRGVKFSGRQMARFVGACRWASRWNAIPTVAQMLLRIKSFVHSLNSMASQWNSLAIYADLYTQLSMNEYEIDINPLVHDYLHGRPLESVDLLTYLQEFLYELCIHPTYKTIFFSSRGNDGVTIFKLKDSQSLEAACKAAVEPFQTSRVLFFDVTAFTKLPQPPLNMGLARAIYDLFAIVCQNDPGQYDLYLRDRTGWLRIGKTIKVVTKYEFASASIMGYIQGLAAVDVHREPVNELKATVYRFIPGEMKFELESRAFPSKKKCLNFLKAQLPDPVKFAGYWIDGSNQKTLPEIFNKEAAVFLEAGEGSQSILGTLFRTGMPEAELRARELKVTIKFPSGTTEVSFERTQKIGDLIDFCEKVREHLGAGPDFLPKAARQDGTPLENGTALSRISQDKPIVIVTFATKVTSVSQTTFLIIDTVSPLKATAEPLPDTPRGNALIETARRRLAAHDLDLFCIGKDNMSIAKIDPME